ncbi:hypothetical protein LP7551_04915 [Roseibium album]|nr:hypothetical protein LP7551_04915 [Roseibium album]
MDFGQDTTIEIDSLRLPVVGVAGGALVVPFDQRVLNYQGRAGVKVNFQNTAWNGNANVRAEQQGEQIHLILTGPKSERKRVASVLKWHVGAAPSFAAGFEDQVDTRRPKGPGVVQGAKVAALGVVAVAMIMLLSFILVQKSSKITAQVAYVGFAGAPLEAHTTGKVTYLQSDGLVRAGEMFAVLETPAGFAKFLEATTEGVVSGAAANNGDLVRKGQPLVRVSPENAEPYIAAFVRSDEIVAALGAPWVDITFLSTGKTVEIPGSYGKYVKSKRLISDETGAVLVELEFELPDGVHAQEGEPLRVEFKKPNWDSGVLDPYRFWF